MDFEKDQVSGQTAGRRSRDAPGLPDADPGRDGKQPRSTAGFVLGLCSVIVPFVCLPLVLPALACGIIGIVLTAPAKNAERTRLAGAGFVLSVIGTTISALLVLLLAILLFFLIGGAGVMLEDLGRATASGPNLGPIWEAIADSVRAPP